MSFGKLGTGASFGGSPLPKMAGFESDVNADINVTPMIDVMLVLLIIFMVVTPALAGYKADLPNVRHSAPEKEDRVTLGIDAQGKFYVESDKGAKEFTAQQLTKALLDEYARRPDDHILYLKADENVGYDKVLTAIDAARNAGVRKIGAITETPAGTPRRD
ncbi:MAG TPA: biopolymer transporter ExbD [Longimicrobiaceae bacterium]|nr:biopolymer transporter ExbD [Longimicrobiaceae bacterium]